MKQIFIVLISIFSFTNLSAREITDQTSSLCGKDDRELSDIPEVGRMFDNSGPFCSGGMIGESCFMTAGHCVDQGVDNVYVEFDVPLSNSNGKTVSSDAKNIYQVDKTTLVYKAELSNFNDFAIMQLKPNKLTGKKAGQVQGHYDPSFDPVKAGDKLQIAGFGTDSSRYERNQAQQVHAGPVLAEPTYLEYIIDTTPGNSGSPVIVHGTHFVVGVHSQGGCNGSTSGNGGTALSISKDAQKAILSCLKNQSLQ